MVFGCNKKLDQLIVFGSLVGTRKNENEIHKKMKSGLTFGTPGYIDTSINVVWIENERSK